MRQLTRRVFATLMAGFFCLVVVACDRGEPAGSDSTSSAATTDTVSTKSKGSIGLSVLTQTNPFFNDIADAMTAEAARHGFDVLVVSGENDPARQSNQVKDFIVQNVSAIVLTPCDSKAIGESIKEANQAGIPVLTADIASMSPDAEVVAHIATDNYQGGRQAAQAMMKALDNQGQVAIIDHPEVESVILRTKGFRDELKEKNSPITIVGAWPGKGSRDVSFNVAQDILQSWPDLKGIFAINDPSALGAVAALEKANRGGAIAIVGFDGMPEGKQAILDGKIFADPVQYPREIGIKTVEAIMKYLNGETVPPQILIPTGLYEKADAEKDPDLQ